MAIYDELVDVKMREGMSHADAVAFADWGRRKRGPHFEGWARKYVDSTLDRLGRKTFPKSPDRPGYSPETGYAVSVPLYTEEKRSAMEAASASYPVVSASITPQMQNAVKAAAVKLSAALKVGDKIKIKGGEKEVEMTVESMQINREDVEKAKKGDEIGILVPEDVHKGYKVFK